MGDYLDRAVTSSLPPLGDTEALSRHVLDSLSGFGALQPYLDDPTIDHYGYHLYDFDQTHVLGAVASWDIGAGFEVGGRFRYATPSCGQAATR